MKGGCTMISEMIPWLGEPNLLTIIIRTFLAIICAGAIGSDRVIHGAAAGFRTHILVCVGAMLAMSTGQYAAMLYDGIDATRIGAQVVSGIGFLGAGTIIVTRKTHIQGLTTAAGLWASACIGLAIGIGFYEGAIVGAVAVYFTERVLRRVSKALTLKAKAHRSDSSVRIIESDDDLPDSETE